jgi:hypothetical protein
LFYLIVAAAAARGCGTFGVGWSDVNDAVAASKSEVPPVPSPAFYTAQSLCGARKGDRGPVTIPIRSTSGIQPATKGEPAMSSSNSTAASQGTSTTDQPARMLCICSPAGQEDFIRDVGVPVETRTTPPQ